jgi:hypothetical protein
MRAERFERLFAEMGAILNTPIELAAEAEFSVGIGKVIAKTKSSPQFRSQLRQYLETRTSSILESLNQELLDKAIAELKRRYQKRGLVIVEYVIKAHGQGGSRAADRSKYRRYPCGGGFHRSQGVARDSGKCGSMAWFGIIKDELGFEWERS